MEKEKILVERLINKDKGAFEQVFDEYFEALVRYAYRFLETVEESEEVVQEIFVKFWERCETLSRDSTIKYYLYRAVHNECLNVLKHKGVKDAYSQHVVAFMESSEEMHLEEDNDDERKALLLKEIEQLPPRCAEIFKLNRMEGLRYQEIADYLNISIKTVEVQIGKALKTLRERLVEVKNSQGADE